MHTALQLADPNLIIFGKLALAAILGMVIGTERATAGKNAGTRTFALVALGSCLAMVVGSTMDAKVLGLVNFDPTRVLAAIVQGIGFLGAGMILFQENRHQLQGMTTAAGLWVVAGLGIAVGAGMYLVAIFTTVLIIFVFTAVWLIENRIKQWIHRGGEQPVLEAVKGADLADAYEREEDL